MIIRIISKSSHRCLTSLISTVVLSMSVYCPAQDSVILKNGNTLSGELTDSATLGVITLTNTESKTPIKIKETSVSQVIFDSVAHKEITLPENIHLLNGDHFPCKVTEIDEQSVSFRSESLGNHTIDRNNISTIRFNTTANKPLYLGPGDDLSAWKTSSEDWKLDNGKLMTDTRSNAAIPINNLTENYILEFNTDWAGSHPHFRVYFSSNSETATTKMDSYYLDLNSYGLLLCRRKNSKSLAQAQALADDDIYSRSSLHVAIHVDRKNKRVALYLNGKLAKILSDTESPDSPAGNYVIIKTFQRTGTLTRISDIKVSSWSGKVTTDLKGKADALAKNDLITDLFGNVMTGQVLGLSETNEKADLSFQAPFAKSHSKIPKKTLNLLEFQTSVTDSKPQNSTFHLKLISGGLISFSSSQLQDGKITVDHPVLGQISLPRESLSSVSLKPQAKHKPKHILPVRKENQADEK